MTFVLLNLIDLRELKGENLKNVHHCMHLSLSTKNLILNQTLSVDHDDVLVVIQLIARHLLIVLDCCWKIAIDSRRDSRLDVDVRQPLSQDGAVGAMVRRLLGLELLSQMRKVMTRRRRIMTTFLIVHLLLHWRHRFRHGAADSRSKPWSDVVQNDLLVGRCYWLRRFWMSLGVCGC